MRILALLVALPLLLLLGQDAHAIKVTLFVDVDTFVERAHDIVIAKCLGPVPDSTRYDDGLYPVDVKVIAVLKGTRMPGTLKIATIYPMVAGKTYLLSSLGGSAYEADFMAVPQLSVVELPAHFQREELKGKTIAEQVRTVFVARRQQVELLQRSLAEEMDLLKRATSK